MSAEQAILEIDTMLADAKEYLDHRKLDPDWRRRVAVEIARADVMLDELETRHRIKIQVLSQKQVLAILRLRNKVSILKDRILSARVS